MFRAGFVSGTPRGVFGRRGVASCRIMQRLPSGGWKKTSCFVLFPFFVLSQRRLRDWGLSGGRDAASIPACPVFGARNIGMLEDKEKRRLEQLERKKEAQRLLDEEAASLKGKLQKNVATPPKITRAQIEETLRVEEKEASKSAEKPKSHVETPLEENINRRVLEEGTVEARTVEEAISVLSVAEELDRHPERRVKAAFAAYEELNMPRLKQENPNMRLSQLKQLLKKEWMKSPENPMNQRHVSYNAPK
ncbi:hypothetical protein NDU88_005945 [Pleurodeles waltl]|uniref:Coiled-coil domain-containing protein n=1 Tax=Pleurodeles waltl TaxID=8319 RepID=A0AAV7LE64_PLEWA|nr:hypothetical protein NDU88_005945 [Pleurodeles waltl]